MAPSTSTDTTAPAYLDGVIRTGVNLFACRVPSIEDAPLAFDIADRLMITGNHDPELAVRIALSRALEEAGSPLGRNAQAYLQAAILIIHNYGHPGHRKG